MICAQCEKTAERDRFNLWPKGWISIMVGTVTVCGPKCGYAYKIEHDPYGAPGFAKRFGIKSARKRRKKGER